MELECTSIIKSAMEPILESMKSKPLQSPWVLMISALYAFCIPWIAMTIIHRYWIQHDYNVALPGLDTTFARKFFMVGHMSLGALCLLLGPTQFIPCIRRKYRLFHRICGRIYVISAITCSIFGFIFICLKRFILVGGLNMGFAFATAGILFGACATLTGYYASKRMFMKHRNWAIRSYSQILAPMLYRYFYLLLGSMGAYTFSGRICNDNDVCKPFTDTFDSIHAWTYFLFPLLCAELIVRSLPQQNQQCVQEVEMDVHDASSSAQEEDVEMKIIDEGVTCYDAIQQQQKQSSATVFDYTKFNVLGIILAICCIGSTVLIYAY